MTDKPKLRKKVRYAVAPGGKEEDAGPWKDNPDNPASVGFVSLTDRSERAKARWWALRSRRSTRQTHGVYDA